MQARILENGNLLVTVDNETQDILQTMQQEQGDTFCTDNTMCDIFEMLTANSEYDWASPEECGVLTSAPILATRDEDNDVVDCWGYMTYALHSPQEELAAKGSCIFDSGQ